MGRYLMQGGHPVRVERAHLSGAVGCVVCGVNTHTLALPAIMKGSPLIWAQRKPFLAGMCCRQKSRMLVLWPACVCLRLL